MPRISTGNTKLGSIANISLTPIASCKGSENICAKDCYAIKAYRQYPNVRAAWDSNYKLATEDPEAYFNGVRRFLTRYKGKYFRWHVAGDISESSYLISVAVIAEDFPDKTFKILTKQYDIVNRFLEYCRLPSNLRLGLSAWPRLGLDNPHKLPVAYMQDGTETRTTGKEFVCQGSCSKCLVCYDTSVDVVFNKH